MGQGSTDPHSAPPDGARRTGGEPVRVRAPAPRARRPVATDLGNGKPAAAWRAGGREPGSRVEGAADSTRASAPGDERSSRLPATTSSTQPAQASLEVPPSHAGHDRRRQAPLGSELPALCSQSQGPPSPRGRYVPRRPGAVWRRPARSSAILISICEGARLPCPRKQPGRPKTVVLGTIQGSRREKVDNRRGSCDIFWCWRGGTTRSWSPRLGWAALT